MTWRLWAVGAALVLAAPGVARAQTSQPEVQLQLEADTVGVGDVVHVQMSVTSADEMPSDAQIGPTPGFVVRGQSASPAQTHILANGTRMDRYTLTTDWALQAQRVGSFAVGPLTAMVAGSRYATQKVAIRVVPAGQAPRRARPQARPNPFGFSTSPFDPWRGLFPGMDDGSEQAPQAPAVNVDPRLSLEPPRGSYFFLHATVDKATAVVGEQVTFTVYEYADTSAGDIEVDGDDVRDPQAADFVKHPLVPEDQEAPVAGYASSGGRTWLVKIVRRWALFPLHSGDLAIGPMSVTLTRPRAAAGEPRLTESLVVRVADPPLAGRPPAFSVGDVGRFALAAQVAPRDVDQGGAVGVHVDLSGTGNVPETLNPPVRDGVEWLTPEVHSELGATAQGGYGGKRSFDFVVHLKRAGAVDLGEMALPYWDPELRRYNVARAPLGIVHVKASAAAEADKMDAPPERLAGLPAPRDGLEGVRAAGRHADDSPLFWWFGVGGGPLLFGAAVAGRASARRVKRAWSGRRASPLADLRERLRALRAARHQTDARAIDAAITRALEAAAVTHAKVGIRGALGGADVVGRLERAGVAPTLASGISELMGECEKARFAPEASELDASRARASRALEMVGELEKRV